MTLRKRRTPSPAFKIPPPYNPISGEQSQLMVGGLFPYCAMMQVAADDTEADYVICRGFDPRVKRYFDYVEGDASKPGIPVAKPYGSRQAGVYTVGQVFPAVLPLTKLGQNPGVAATSEGHPADLNEAVSILYTTDSKAVNWLLIDTGSSISWYRLTANLDCGGTATAKKGEWDDVNSVWGESADADETLTDPTGCHWGLEGEWLPARAGPGGLEVIASGKEHHVATLSANLLTGSSAAATVAIDGVTADVTVFDHGDLGMAASKKIVSGGKVRIWYETEGEKWYADWAKCAAVVAQ